MLRFINETVDQIQKNKRLPEVGRDTLVTNVLLRYLEKAGLQREQGEECGNNQRSAGGAIPNMEQLPMLMPEINAALDAIAELTVVEKVIFADDLKRLGRKEQEEFIACFKQNT